jgi:glucokinase
MLWTRQTALTCSGDDAMTKPHPQAPYVLGADIGGTKLSTVLATRTGQIVHRVRRPTEAELGPEIGVARLIEMLHETIRAPEMVLDPVQIAGIGVACGSPMNAEQGVILGPPNLQSWNPVPIKEILEREFGLYTRLENDANAGALAEWLFGAGRGRRHVVYLTMGTGIGGGLILDGRLYRGANGNAGEIGHMRVVDRGGPLCGCGKRGCLEAFCSGPSIARRAREALTAAPDSLWAKGVRETLGGDLDRVTSEHVFGGARAGDPLALHLVDETAHYMGVALANVIQAFNPEVIVLGTIATAQGDFFLDRVRRVVREETWPLMGEIVEIAPSPLGGRVGDYAAISVLLQETGRAP